jgi:hypothetical protein
VGIVELRRRVIPTFILLAIGFTCAMGSTAVAADDQAVRVTRELHDEHLKCNGDSARLVVNATLDGEPAEGIRIRILISGKEVWLTTNSAGRAMAHITPSPGAAAHFTYIFSYPRRYNSAYLHSVSVGSCPFVPGADTGTLSGKLVDELGGPVRGENVSAEIRGYSAGSTIPPHWTRTRGDGAFSWDGVPHWWENDHPYVLGVVCLAEKSSFEFKSIDGVQLEEPGRCVAGPPLDRPPVVYGVQKRR